MRTILNHAWIPLLIALIVAVGGFSVSQVRGIFGAEPIVIAPKDISQGSKAFGPKVVTYEILGPPGAVADITYLGPNSQLQRVEGAWLPWALAVITGVAAPSPTIAAQGRASTITCRIFVDNELEAERTAFGVSAHTFCLAKFE